MESKNEVIKARPAIQITGYITLLQRQLWNVLLANAYDLLPKQAVHRISVADLASMVGFDSKNEQYLKSSVKALMACLVEWNLLSDKGQKQWGAATLLARVAIEDGICTYEYSNFMCEQLHNPGIYSRINLLMQTQFKSKHDLALWELCSDYQKVKSTGWIPLDQFKALMGVQSGSIYHQFMNFNQKVIKPAIQEINEVSDLHIEVEFERWARKVAKVRFLIKQKKKPTKDSTAKEKTKALVEQSIEASGVQPEDVAKLKGKKKDTAQQTLFSIIEKVKK